MTGTTHTRAHTANPFGLLTLSSAHELDSAVVSNQNCVLFTADTLIQTHTPPVPSWKAGWQLGFNEQRGVCQRVNGTVKFSFFSPHSFVTEHLYFRSNVFEFKWPRFDFRCFSVDKWAGDPLDPVHWSEGLQQQPVGERRSWSPHCFGWDLWLQQPRAHLTDPYAEHTGGYSSSHLFTIMIKTLFKFHLSSPICPKKRKKNNKLT